MSELRTIQKHPLDALRDTRIAGDSVFNGNGRDDYEIAVEWSEKTDKNLPGDVKKLKEATITIRLVQEA